MNISVFDIFKIGIGPSSSHTLGPWLAALEISRYSFDTISIHLYGSLALTGKGHYTDKAITMGLLGYTPKDTSNSDLEILKNSPHTLNNNCLFSAKENIHFHSNKKLDFHSNGMTFILSYNNTTTEHTYYSIGGGFVVREDEINQGISEEKTFKHQYSSASELLNICTQNTMKIHQISKENETVSSSEINLQLDELIDTMKQSAYLGCHTEGILPGGLNVKRRAYSINKSLLGDLSYNSIEEWINCMKQKHNFQKVTMRVSCIAMAVNEVNAAMGKIVTAPTNGSAGVIPAVMFYLECFSGKEINKQDLRNYLLTAGEIGKLFKQGATISAAAGGCQAEIGVSSAMAAAGLTAVMGGSNEQSLMAAEIAAEHHLGLTCDPVKGLVQIPCIERNSMGAIKAITASMIALASDPSSAKVSLDQLIATMKDTAEAMHYNYKETSLGGLATKVGVGVPEC